MHGHNQRTNIVCEGRYRKCIAIGTGYHMADGSAGKVVDIEVEEVVIEEVVI